MEEWTEPFRAGTLLTQILTPTTHMVQSILALFKFQLHQIVDFSLINVCQCLTVTDPSVLRGALCGHTDSVWGLVYSLAHQRLLSCSADGTVRLWSAADTSPALAVFNEDAGKSTNLNPYPHSLTRFYNSITYS